jgi:hypothetical protein
MRSPRVGADGRDGKISRLEGRLASMTAGPTLVFRDGRSILSRLKEMST